MKHTKPKKKRTYKRPGKTTKDEKEVIKAVVRQTGGDVPLDKTMALAKVFNRPVSTIKKQIQTAKEDLAADAGFYVDAHRDVVETALEVGKATFNDKLLASFDLGTHEERWVTGAQGDKVASTISSSGLAEDMATPGR